MYSAKNKLDWGAQMLGQKIGKCLQGMKGFV